MAERIEAGKIADFKDNEIKESIAGERKVIVVKIDGKYYAADAKCPHMQADLSQGKLEGTVITCPLHGSRFDLKDGSVVNWLGMTGIALKAAGALHVPKKIGIYKVEIDGDTVLVEV
jgi:3-phenylpropionate/trans-cinnamate dioxygenase ferredoxin subunit